MPLTRRLLRRTRLLHKRLRDIEADDNEAADDRQARFVEMMNLSPIALVPERI